MGANPRRLLFSITLLGKKEYYVYNKSSHLCWRVRLHGPLDSPFIPQTIIGFKQIEFFLDRIDCGEAMSW
jgi:hypothetical protein